MEKRLSDFEIRHEAAARRYVAAVGRESAVLEYEPMEGGTWDLRRTYVPEEHRRRGIASQLVRFALEEAVANGRKIIPSCWFVADFIEEHPRYRDLLVSRAG